MSQQPPILRVANLAKRFGNVTVLRDVSLEIAKGEVVVVMGPSGSGKTTFIRCLNALEVPDSGSVEACGVQVDYNGRRLDRATRSRIRDIRLRTAMVFQSFNLFPHMTAAANVMEGMISARGATREAAEARARELLTQVGLAEKTDAYPGRLSGGQKQRVAIARALAMDPQLILFDEPTSALDPELRNEVLKVMRNLANLGMSMIVVTHEVRFAREVADRIIFMEGGVVVDDATPAEFFGGRTSARSAQFLQEIE